MDDRNHQAFGHGAGLRSFPTQMGYRTYFRMARSLSQTGKGFRSDNRQRRCLGIRRPHPNPHPATRKSLRSNAIIMNIYRTRWPPRRAVNVVAPSCILEQSRFQPAIVCKTRVLLIASATVRFIGVAILWVPTASAPAGFVQRSSGGGLFSFNRTGGSCWRCNRYAG